MKIIKALLFTLVLSGCDFLKDVEILFNEIDELESTIQRQFGDVSSISYDHTNGYFVLWVSIPVEPVKSEAVEEIYKRIYIEATETLTDTPDEIYVNIGGKVSTL